MGVILRRWRASKIEFTTQSSRYKDLGTKKGLYEALGVKEYFLFDPVQEYLKPAFRAFHLIDGVLTEKEQKSSHFSEELGLTLKPVGKLLRFFPPNSLTPVPSSEELEDLADSLAEEAKRHAHRADQEAARADELERQLKELRSRQS